MGGASASDRPTTALIRSFICLYTHDLRRKQKRWQDGKLRYHTFNRRVMVYDERGGFVGDAHWQEDHDLDDGEELQLDRGSAIVQVCECTGEQQQDLTEILDKRAQEVEKRRANAAARAGGVLSQQGMRTPAPSSRAAIPTAMTTPIPGRQETTRPHFQLLHRPLSAIVPSPGPIGRAAVPEHSPYEARRAEHGQRGSDEPVSKRRRLSTSPPSGSKSAFATRLFGATLTLNGTAGAFAARNRILRDATNMQTRPEANSPQDVQEKSGEVEKEEDADVVMLDGPNIEHRTHSSVPRSRIQDAVHPISRPPAPRLREPQYPRASLHSQVSRHEKATSKSNRAQSPSEPQPPKKPRTTDFQDQHIEKMADDEENSPEPSPIRPSSTRRSTAVGERSKQQTSKKAPKPIDETINVSDTDLAPTISKRAAMTTHDNRYSHKLSEEPLEHTPEEPPKELRTELRIKPRRKRGLLMVSEKAIKRTTDGKSSGSEIDQQRVITPVPRGATESNSAPNLEAANAPIVEGVEEDEEVPQSPPRSEVHGNSPGTDDMPDPDEIENEDPVLATDSEKSEDEEVVKLSRRKELQKTKPQSNAAYDDIELQPQTTTDKRLDDDHDDAAAFQRPGRSRRVKANAERDNQNGENKPDASIDNHNENTTEAHSTHMSEEEPPKHRQTRLTRAYEKVETNPVEEDDVSKGEDLEQTASFSSNQESEDELPIARHAKRRGRDKQISVDEEDSDDSPKTRKRASRRATAQRKSYTEDFPFTSDLSEDETPRVATKTDAKKKNKKQQQQEEEEPKETGPRIARMARKSVKSKEIFGFVLPENNLVPSPMAMAFGRVAPVIETEPAVPEKRGEQSRGEAEPQPVTHRTGTLKPSAEPASAPVPRIVNPATRGKKAARKEDAAGLAPQAMVPSDPAPVTTRRAAAPLSRGGDKTSAGPLPGFSKASGGTWSKHAEDLLGMTRPGGPR